MSVENEIAKQWLAKARSDLLNADNNLRSDQIPFDTVCFHCQQAAEKILKAYLVAMGKQPPFTHDLLLLLEVILRINTEAETLRNTLASLMPYAVEIRYPGDAFMPSRQDALEARKNAERIRAWFACELPDAIL